MRGKDFHQKLHPILKSLTFHHHKLLGPLLHNIPLAHMTQRRLSRLQEQCVTSRRPLAGQFSCTFGETQDRNYLPTESLFFRLTRRQFTDTDPDL